MATTSLQIGVSIGCILGPVVGEFMEDRGGYGKSCAWGGTYMLAMAALYSWVTR